MMKLKSIDILSNFILFKLGKTSFGVKIARKKGVIVGKSCRFFSVNFGSEPYLISIGDHCEIGIDVNFITHDGATWLFRENKQFLGSKFGAIKIHENCFIGNHSIILPNVEIGPNSIVGAGSVVTKNVLTNSVFAGNPAKYICSIDEYLNTCKYSNIGNTGLSDYKSEIQKEEIIKKLFENFLEK